MSGEDIASSWAATGTTEEWHATQTFFAHYDPTNTTKWRHRRPGRSPRWEDLLVKVFGDWWRTNGLDRRAWHSSRSFFVWQACNFLLGTGHRAFGVCESPAESHEVPTCCIHSLAPQETMRCEIQPPGCIATWKSVHIGSFIAQKALDWLHHGLLLQIIGDSQIVVDVGLGRAKSSHPQIAHSMRVAQEALRQLTQNFCSQTPDWACQTMDKTVTRRNATN